MRIIFLSLVFFPISTWALGPHGHTPQISGQIHAPYGLNYSGAELNLTMALTYEGRETPKDTVTVLAKWDPTHTHFTFPSVPFGRSLVRKNFLTDGWGTRADFRVSLRLPHYDTFNDLHIWGWEGRPGNTIDEALRNLRTHVQDLSLYQTDEPTVLKLSTKNVDAVRDALRNRRAVYFFAQRDFFFIEGLQKTSAQGNSFNGEQSIPPVNWWYEVGPHRGPCATQA